MQALSNLALSNLDIIALLWFLLCWFSYTRHVNTSPKSLVNSMARWRTRWSLAMLQRENRIMDAQVITGLNSVVTFFCSTSIFITAAFLPLLVHLSKSFYSSINCRFCKPPISPPLNSNWDC